MPKGRILSACLLSAAVLILGTVLCLVHFLIAGFVLFLILLVIHRITSIQFLAVVRRIIISGSSRFILCFENNRSQKACRYCRGNPTGCCL